jgi:cytochrome c5
MKRNTTIRTAFAAALLSAGCTSKLLPHRKEESTQTTKMTKAPGPVVTDTSGKNSSDERLVQGETIFGQKCGSCHEFHEPGDFTVTEWNNVLPVMVKRAKLNADEADMVKTWIIAHAKQG